MSAKFQIASYVHPGSLLNPSGVGMLTLNMTLALARNPDVELKLLVSADELAGDDMLPAGHPLHGIPAIGLPGSYKLREACWLACHRPALDRYLGPDWWIYNSMETYTPAHRCRRIVTVHHFDPPNRGHIYSKRWWRDCFREFRLRRAVSSADLLVAQSSFTRDHILSRYAVDSARVSVVGSGFDAEEFSAADGKTEYPDRLQLQTPYIISVGAFQLRKGVDYLIALAQELKRRRVGLTIVCPFSAPDPLRTPPELDAYHRLARDLPNLKLLGYVSRRDLLSLIQKAQCMIILSRLEGFGLTAVESMALGTPVIASNNSALPETLGGAGVLVEPGDTLGVADAVERLNRSGEIRQQISKAGLQRARYFTWTACMNRLLDSLVRISTSDTSQRRLTGSA